MCIFLSPSSPFYLFECIHIAKCHTFFLHPSTNNIYDSYISKSHIRALNSKSSFQVRILSIRQIQPRIIILVDHNMPRSERPNHSVLSIISNSADGPTHRPRSRIVLVRNLVTEIGPSRLMVKVVRITLLVNDCLLARMNQVQIQESIVRFHAVDEGSNAGSRGVDSSFPEREGLGFRVEGGRRDGHLGGDFVGIGGISKMHSSVSGNW